MKSIQKLVLLLLLALTVHLEASLPVEVGYPDLTTYVEENLPLQGTIAQNSKGFVYVNLPDSFILELYPFLQTIDPEAVLPPYFNFKEAAGAHITLVTPDEGVDFPDELIGKEVSFKITGFYSATPDGPSIWSKVYFLEVEAPELEDIRESLGLPPKLNGGHSFHITIGYRYF